MDTKNKNDELQSRRDFFKKAAKGVLPILGAVVLANIPSFVKATKPQKTGCESSCYNTCAGRCTDSCSGCGGVCQTGCMNTCKGYCSRTCTGTCSTSCSGSCSYSSKR